MHMYLFFLCSVLAMSVYIYKSKTYVREIAITIDDVPTDRPLFEKIMNHLNAYDAPAALFAIANRLNDDEYAFLQKIKNEHIIIGNHTYSHKKLSKTPAKEFIQDVGRADDILLPLLSERRYFRYPYLAMGKRFKKFQIRHYLKKKNYVIAPVTVRSLDVRLDKLLTNQPHTPSFLENIKHQYLDYVWKRTLKGEKKLKLFNKKQILLIHANRLNAYFLGDLLKMYQDKGYRFITLDAALGFDKIIKS